MAISLNNGYRYSIWYVPEDHEEFARAYNIQHIPHITFATNLTYDQALVLFNSSIHKAIFVRFISSIEKFPSMYENDPLRACGWYVETIAPKSFQTPHRLHMSVNYGDTTSSQVDIPKPVLCHIALVDTLSSDPVNWRILDMVLFS